MGAGAKCRCFPSGTSYRLASYSKKADRCARADRFGARAIDRARGRLRHDTPEETVALWKVLVGGRWSLVDHFERDGRRYVVACRDAPELAPHVTRASDHRTRRARALEQVHRV